jgi:23S rRNA A2030 N6-methylase RlmJ
VANIHFGEFGDVWKHLLLAHLISTIRPAQYWETHAGSANYELDESLRRRFGVPHFERLAAQSRVLRSTKYYALIKSHVAAQPQTYPGSASLAMAILRDRARYLFCDIDLHSLNNIRATAAGMRIDRSLVEVERGDGPSLVATRADRLTPTQTRDVFVFVDPYWPLETGRSVMTSVELVSYLATSGCRAVLWYGCTNTDRVQEMKDALCRAGLPGHPNSHFGIQIDGSRDDLVHAHIGLRRFGLVCVNIDASVIESCRALSAEMAKRITIESHAPSVTMSSLQLSTYRGESIPSWRKAHRERPAAQPSS